MAALTPSLMPRPWLIEGLIGGIGAAFGYGAGTFVSWAIRRSAVREPSPHAKRIAWRTLVVAGSVIAIGAIVLGGRWQNEIRALVGQAPEPAADLVATALVALGVAMLTVAGSRALRRLAAWVGRALGRVIPARIAQVIGVAVVALVLYGLAAGVVFDGLVSIADSAYAGANARTAPGVHQPQAAERSGSPDSLVDWTTLGVRGRTFVASGPSTADLQAFSGRPAVEPIRVYVGLDSAPTARERADLAVRELGRAGAFDRSVLVVAGATGTGWLEPQSVDAVEYLWNGDTAIVAVQYSYLPSWISTVVDKQDAADAGRALFDAVFAAWTSLPAEHRPKLIVYGLSLGAFAIQSAFATAGDLVARTDGALLVGGPNFSQPWADITRTRDPGSPEWQPVYRRGRNVRFASRPADLRHPATRWEHPRVVFLQHAGDAVVWWSPSLLARRPDWLSEPRGPDVTPRMRWFPFLTFLQVTLDQALSASVPDGYGHNYAATIVGAWAAVVPPAGWTEADSVRLQALIDASP